MAHYTVRRAGRLWAVVRPDGTEYAQFPTRALARAYCRICNTEAMHWEMAS